MKKYLSLSIITLWLSGMVFGVLFISNLTMAAAITSITLNDPNGNGKINQVVIVFDGNVQLEDVTDVVPDGRKVDFSVTLSGAAIDISTLVESPAGTITLTLDENDADLTVNTGNILEVFYTDPGTNQVIEYASDNSDIAITTGDAGGAQVVEADGAKPVVTAVDFKTNTISSLAYNAVQITYSEAVDVSTDGGGDIDIAAGASATSTTTLGDMTTAKTLTGIGAWDGASDMTTFIAGSNNIALDATGKILTISVNAVNAAGSYFNAGSTAPTTPTFTPIADVNDIADSANNAVNTATRAATNTVVWDVTKPTITSVTLDDVAGAAGNGKVDQATVVFNSAIRDNSITNGDALLGGGANAGTFTTGTANDATTVFNLTADTLATDTSATAAQFTYSGATTLIRDIAGNLLDTATDGQIANADTVEVDGAKPVLVTAVKGTASNQNTLVLTYSEPMYIDNSNQDGNIDAADTTSNESLTSTATVGGISAAGTIRNVGTFGTAGTVTQNAETVNTLGVSANGLVLTITLNTGALSHFTNSVTVPSGAFTPANVAYVLAQAPAAVPAGAQRINTTATAPTSSGSWDLTAPTAVGGLQVVGAGATTIRLNFSPPAAPADFSRYQVYYRQGTSGTTFLNGTAWTTTNDPLLATSTTSSTLVSGLNTGYTYYFIAYGVDIGGNVSAASNETSVATSSTSGADVTAPGVPTGVTASIDASNHVALSWTDPTATDLSKIWILRGKNSNPISGTAYSQVLKGVKVYTDTDVAVNDVVKYQLRAEDTSGNLSTLSDIVTITVTAAATPVVTTPTGEVVTPPVEETTPPAAEGEGEEAVIPPAEGEGEEAAEGEGEGEAAAEAVTEIFTDLPETHWATDAIQDFYDSGVVQGYPDGTFKAGKAANRAEALKMIMLAFEFDVDTEATVSAPFTDVPTSEWYAPYVAFAKAAGYVAGRGTVTKLFEPASEINRAEVLALILRMKGISVSSYRATGDKSFTDVKSGDWFYTVVMYAADNEIVSGFGDGTFKPGQAATRAEILMMLANSL